MSKRLSSKGVAVLVALLCCFAFTKTGWASCPPNGFLPDGYTPGPTTWSSSSKLETDYATGCQWTVNFCYGTDATGHLFIYVDYIEWATGTGCPDHYADAATILRVTEALQKDYIWFLTYGVIADCQSGFTTVSTLAVARCWMEIDLHTQTGGHENYRYQACPVAEGSTCLKTCQECYDGLLLKITDCLYSEIGSFQGCPIAPPLGEWNPLLCYDIGCYDNP